ncbi:MAG: LytTR family transcriptional regulator [Treponema sp.]|uniref:LytTR family DNA-binding domain-containing protein n=1 Tax=Treponema sp. TaxID=166 RepID=UPI0025F5EF7F|nr:LytTR family DNA-binding domain-containing protein [Treponema sp.]MBQ9623424.1 LytTR family transcriptional regulator [Treponema sp.]MBR0497246.1 LytTR family transcriptional regulator [Treponema sp.]
MKITILDNTDGSEDEVIVRCSVLDESLISLLNSFKHGKQKRTVYKDDRIFLIDDNDAFYFESVDDRVFVYTASDVYETRSKLYQLENELPQKDFMRANKAVIINLNKIKSLAPAFGGRFEATIENGYKVIISRMYVPVLKERLGL